MKLVFASDSFKGTLSSARIAELLEKAAGRLPGTCICEKVIMADGGEGTTEAVLASVGGSMKKLTVSGPLGEPVEAFYGVTGDGRAVIETAAASGLALLQESQRDPFRTSTYGTGQLIAHALDAGIRDITLCLGGSATNDGGTGALQALGAVFYGADGLPVAPCGGNLGLIRRIDVSRMHAGIKKSRFTAMCDVNNPLTGPRGATYTFAPQKGAAGARELDILERGMESYAALVCAAFPGADTNFPGAGAAGGLGMAARVFLGAEMTPGAQAVLDLCSFDGLIADADLVITGEGRADGQSLDGKAVGAVAARCGKAGVPAVALVGSVGEGAQALYGRGITLIRAVSPDGRCPSTADEAEKLYFRAACGLFDDLAKCGLRPETPRG